MKQLLISVILLFSISLPALCQISNSYFGIYNVQDDAVSLFEYLYKDPVTWKHNISDYYSISIDQINVDSVSISNIGGYHVNAFVQIDSLHFNFTDNITKDNINGKGKFYNDSIKYAFFASGRNGAFYITSSGHKIPNGLNDLVGTNQLKCYPNPFINNITLSFEVPNSTNRVSLNIYSATGLLLKKIEIVEKGQLTKTFSLEDLNKGVFFGVITLNNKGINYIKLIKE